MSDLRKKAALSVLLMVSMGHFLNDMFQAVLQGLFVLTGILPTGIVGRNNGILAFCQLFFTIFLVYSLHY